MAHQRKSKHDRHTHRTGEFLDEEDRLFFAQLRWKTVKDTTRRQYNGRVAMLDEKYGGHEFGHVARYVHLHKEHAVATKRATVSAVSDYRWCEMSPMTTDEVATLTFALDALEVEEQERMERATLTPAQFAQLISYMVANDVSIDAIEGAEVMCDLACRTFNIRDLTRERLHLGTQEVECEKKGTDLMKRRKGKYDLKRYETGRTHQILQERAAEAKQKNMPMNAALFPAWDPDEVSQAMRACAKKHKWPADFVYCCYCLRHTAAAAEYAKAHEVAKAAVRARLAHKAQGNEMRYGASTEERRARRGRGGGAAEA